MRLYDALLLLACVQTAIAATAVEWRDRTIYQVMTDRYGLSNASTTAWCDAGVGVYCGGTWQGIIHNLDYIQNMGFTAIWISPITANLPQYTTDLASYHGYWQQNMYALNSNFGQVADLQALSKAVHDRGMYLMVDVVVNHFAWAGDPSTVQYDRLIPFNDVSYYHSYCPITGNASTTACWLGDEVISLPDLRTEDDDVRSIFNTWISTLVKTYNIDGLRLDSAGNVEKEFFSGFSEAAGVYCIGEIYSGVPEYACPYQEVLDGVLNYPIYFPLVRAFASPSGTFYDLMDEISLVKTECKDSSLLGSFSENHDQPRFASYTSDISLAKNVLTYTFLSDGIPIVYQGQEQHLTGAHNPLNREAIWLSAYNTGAPLYNFTTSLNIFRSHVIGTSPNYTNYNSDVTYNDSSTLALRKGINGSQVVTVLTNRGEAGQASVLSLSMNATGYDPGMVVTDVVSCSNATVDGNGTLSVKIDSGLPTVFYPASLLVDTSICVHGVTLNPAPVKLNPPPKNGAERILDEVKVSLLLGGLVLLLGNAL
ncbi:MAG: hypothetical protein M1818_006645 [Claussenomyces sp. TS43310]|nr:MAG: hypothetical protein M1818_006922 [Claussenomyces sp. TS43310]KAI9735068.1 MAG: hypothetical protein M1818_006645 [Claussenomyces sp. TS43310]